MNSPLRYPGGKGKLYKKVKSIIEENDLSKKTYVEPFAGGFGIGLKLLDNNVVEKAMLNDYDSHIFNFWYCVLNKTDELCKAINDVNITLDERKKQKETYYNPDSDIFDDAFATLFLNRVNYSGIIKAGAIGGLVQTGKYKIDCRFRKNWLIDTITKISEMRKRIKIYNLDASKFICQNLSKMKDRIFLNIDPPYVVKGAQLYTNFFEEADHRNLASLIKARIPHVPWIVTYDNTTLIKELYEEYDVYEYTLNHSAGGSKKGNELAILNKITFKWC